MLLHNNKLLSSSSLQHIDKWTEEAGFGDKATQMFGQNFRRYFKGSWGNRMHMLRFPTDSSVILLVTNNNSTKQDKFMRDIASMLYSTYTPPVEIKEVSVPLSVLERYLVSDTATNSRRGLPVPCKCNLPFSIVIAISLPAANS